jgi:cupredoxin-like protein
LKVQGRPKKSQPRSIEHLLILFLPFLTGLESIHFINEDYDTHSKHNFNIDEFKVHSKDLGYFQSQIITFIVDKDGMFEYYCSIHPEMRGKVVVM